MFVFTEAEREIRTKDRAIVLNEVGLEVLVARSVRPPCTLRRRDYLRRSARNDKYQSTVFGPPTPVIDWIALG
jgi:hypothetical protein